MQRRPLDPATDQGNDSTALPGNNAVASPGALPEFSRNPWKLQTDPFPDHLYPQRRSLTAGLGSAESRPTPLSISSDLNNKY
jgi:hypothetical protein